MFCPCAAPLDIAGLEVAVAIKPTKARAGEELRTNVGQKFGETAFVELSRADSYAAGTVALVLGAALVAALLDHRFPDRILGRARTVLEQSVAASLSAFRARHRHILVEDQVVPLASLSNSMS